MFLGKFLLFVHLTLRSPRLRMRPVVCLWFLAEITQSVTVMRGLQDWLTEWLLLAFWVVQAGQVLPVVVQSTFECIY